jgi:hypothetical protein
MFGFNSFYLKVEKQRILIKGEYSSKFDNVISLLHKQGHLYSSSD